MSKSHPSPGRRLLRAGIATSAVAATVLAAGALPAYAAALAMTLSSAAGPSGGGNSLTGSVTPATGTTGPFTAKPVVQFQYNGTLTAATCGTTAKAVTQIAATSGVLTAGALTVDPADVKRISNAKIAFTVPSASYPALVGGVTSTVNTTGLALQNGQTSAKWNVCVYDTDSTTTSTLLASSTYTISVRPTITSITPSSSPALGGQAISINGTGFSTTANTTTVTVGGTALGSLKVNSGTNITGTAPVHAPGSGLAVVVTTVGGNVSSLDPDNNGLPDDGDPLTTADAPIPFAYSNGMIVTPNTAADGTVVNLDVQGVGFESLAFGNGAPTTADAHVFLVSGAYIPATNHGAEECGDVFVIGDTELVCTLNLNDDVGVTAAGGAASAADAPNGTYTVTVVSSGDPAISAAAATPSIINSGATFTIAPY
jgi:hypothetical protein